MSKIKIKKTQKKKINRIIHRGVRKTIERRMRGMNNFFFIQNYKSKPAKLCLKMNANRTF